MATLNDEVTRLLAAATTMNECAKVLREAFATGVARNSKKEVDALRWRDARLAQAIAVDPDFTAPAWADADALLEDAQTHTVGTREGSDWCAIGLANIAADGPAPSPS